MDLSIDERNPDIVYATFWETYRNFWELSSGGPDSGLWKSTDGGDTWSDITRNKGFPPACSGKIGVAASPAKSGRVWALIEAKDKPGLYRSDDFGETWKLLTDNPDLRHRPWYYMHIYADPQDADTVYILNLDMWKSTDGGKTFTLIGTPHGDNHDLWIDPNDNRRMVQGNDGGACVSFNAGESFSTIYNQNTAQFYHVAVDNEFPYRVYGTQQDNSSIGVPSDTISGAIAWGDCFMAGTGESGYIAVHPDNSDLVYVGAVGSSPGGMGALQRCDMRQRANPTRQRLARIRGRPFARGVQVSLPVDLPHPLLAARPGHALHLRQRGLPLYGRRPQLGAVQPGPDACDESKLVAVGRADHAGHQRRGALRHHLRLHRVAARAGRLLGGQRRRSCPSLARQRRNRGKTSRRRTCPSAPSSARWSRPPTTRQALPGRHPPQAGRPRSLSVQDRGLRSHLAQDHRRHRR